LISRKGPQRSAVQEALRVSTPLHEPPALDHCSRRIIIVIGYAVLQLKAFRDIQYRRVKNSHELKQFINILYGHNCRPTSARRSSWSLHRRFSYAEAANI
jgi:hypothetical protein